MRGTPLGSGLSGWLDMSLAKARALRSRRDTRTQLCRLSLLSNDLCCFIGCRDFLKVAISSIVFGDCVFVGCRVA